MKPWVGMIGAALLLAIGAFLADGYLKTRHSEHAAADQRQAVRAMSAQALAAAIARCDARDRAYADPYCEAVARELDRRPLELVEVKPAAPPRR